jgi:Kef-type K+ transport system membrane component KefB
VAAVARSRRRRGAWALAAALAALVWAWPRSVASGPEALAPGAAHPAVAPAQAGSHAPASEGAAPPGRGVDPAHLFLVLIAIWVAGKLGGELAERARQPAVLGELVAGMLIGSSVLGIVPTAPGNPTAEVVRIFAEIGVVLLLFEIGLETDLQEMFRVGSAAAVVAVVGVLCPFALGTLYWYFADPALGAHPPGVSLLSVAIFVGATLTATSVGITARVLRDLDRLHTPEARTIIGAAVIDDVLGLVILAMVTGLVAGGSFSVPALSWTLVKAVGFLVLAVLVGNRIGPRLFDLIDKLRVRGVLLVAAVSFALLLAALAHLADSAMIIGSFAAGIILSSTNQFDAVLEQVKPVADVFTPIFFVNVGAAVNLRLLWPGAAEFDAGVLAVGGVLLVLAAVGKVVAGFAVVWKRMNRLAVGVGMVPRGEVGLIFADLGRRAGILSEGVFSAVLVMIVFSTLLVPLLLKLAFQRGEPAPAPVGEEVRPPIHESALRSNPGDRHP